MNHRSVERVARSLLVGVAVVLCAVPQVADAADGTGSGGASGGTIWAGVQTGAPPIEGSESSCTWTVESGYDSGLGEGSDAPITMRIGTIDYVLYNRTCSGSSSVVWIPQLDAGQLARQASILVIGRLSAPAIRLAPSADANVVTVGTWIWADPSWWQPVSATAWLPTPGGVMWARTTAVPVDLTFRTEDSPREGGPLRSVTCLGPGEEWTWGIGDDASSSCSYTYRHASSAHVGGRFDADVSVGWSISWESNAGSGGGLPPHTTTTALRVTVHELHALIR